MLNIYRTTPESKMETNFTVISGEIIPVGYYNAAVIFNVTVNNEVSCAFCGSCHVGLHQNHAKQVHAGSYNEVPVFDDFMQKRYHCKDCGRTFMQRIPDLPLYARRVQDMNYAIIHALATRTMADVSESYGVSEQTIKRILCDFGDQEYTIRRNASYKYLSMDEVFITRDNQGNAIYYWILNDISTPWKINNIRIEIGRTKEEVIKRLEELKFPEKVDAVAIDMWSAYKDAIERVLTNAAIVIDPFHVIQTAEREMDTIRKQQGETPTEKKLLKGDAKLFTENMYSLSEEGLQRLEEYIGKYPILEQAYFLLQELIAFYHLRDYEHALKYLATWETEVLKANIPEFIQVLETVQRWLPCIMNYFIHRISNGKTEGRNNLIRTMDRQGFHYGKKSLQSRLYAHDLRQDRKRWLQRQRKQEKMAVKAA